MTTPPAGDNIKEIPFSDADFRAIASLAQSEFGLNLADSKKPLVYSRLSKRLKARNIANFQSYLDLVQNGNEAEEKLELISALTTNVTSFFREKHHFDSLSKECEETLTDKAKSGQRVRIWSAGCSSGQEPYSIAMTLLDKISDAANLNVKILATDIDPKIIERARKGTYKPEDATGIPSHLASRFVSINDDASLSMHESARKLITFAELNLISDWPFHGPFDVIFCRNVAIYFSPETQKELWKRFRDMLTPNGLLFIGHSERVSGPATTDLSPIGITTYRKNGEIARQPSR